MTTVEEIEIAISQLSSAERRELISRLDQQDWDAQIEADAAAGKFDSLIQGLIAEHEAGKTVPLVSIIGQ
jgi:hypothetical protein